MIGGGMKAWSCALCEERRNMRRLVATNYNFTFTTNNVPGSMKFFRIYRGW
jgi:hypothetical protein